jgi:hypothetical protein
MGATAGPSITSFWTSQDAIPTLIEVKRSSDTRIRREVVGQMLDYTANAVVYWPVEAIRARFEERCRERAADPVKEVETLVGSATGVEDFWQRVKTNLQAGRIRMVFVADEIPPELRRIVEFLNGQMDPAEVLAVEIKQFVGRGLRTLVPRLIGQTAEAEKKKGGTRPAEKIWNETSFFQVLQEWRGEKEADAARAILSWAKKNVTRIDWGKGSRYGSFIPVQGPTGEGQTIVFVWTSGSVEIPFQYMSRRKPFDNELNRVELLNRLNQIPGIKIPADEINSRPNVRLAVLANDGTVAKFLAVLDWYVAEVKGA